MSSFPAAIDLPPPSSIGDDSQGNYLIFFVPGNPGPVAYYRAFLSSLHKCLHPDVSAARSRFEIFGRSLSGVDDEPLNRATKGQSTSSMNDEVEGAEVALFDHVRRLATESASPVGVILIGHCSGAYIALELLKRLQQKPLLNGPLNENASSPTGNFQVAGTICLFPTVPMKTFGGTVSQLSTLSRSAMLVHTSVKFFLFLVPSEVVEVLVRSTTGLSESAAKVTSDMIGSKWGVYQALKLWRNQMDDQQNGRWDELIYTSNASTASAPTYMLFGQNEGEPPVGRGRGKLEPVAGIPQSQLPDHFFTSQVQSESVATLVKEYVQEIVGIDRGN